MPTKKKEPEAAVAVEEPLEPAEEETLEGEVVEEDGEPLNELSPVAQEMALAIREERSLAVAPTSSLPTPSEWAAMVAFAGEIARTRFVPESYRGDPESVIAAIQTGRELGIGPMQSLRDIHMIDGRPAFSANLMLGQMRRGGLVILASEATNTRAWIHAKRSDTGEEAEVEWKIEDATAKLLAKDNWKNYPQDMLWARAVGRLCRRLGSDLLAGMVYSSEELRDLEAGTGDYSASTRAPALAWGTLDPGAQLWPNAPKGWKEIDERLRLLDAGLDWKELVARIFQAAYSAGSVAELPDQQVAGRRLANLVSYLEEVVMEGREFPPPSDDELVAAVGWAFEGAIVEIPEPDPGVIEAAQASLDAAASRAAGVAEVEDIPFGEDEQEHPAQADGT